MLTLTARDISITDLESQFNLQYTDNLTFFSEWQDNLPFLQQIAIKHVCVQNAKTLPELDLVTHPCGGLALKLL